MAVHRFQKGQSGNPGGRPCVRGIREMIQSQTKQGAELVEYALEVLRDKNARTSDRNYAHTWLSDRGWGKAVEHVEVTQRVTLEDILEEIHSKNVTPISQAS